MDVGGLSQTDGMANRSTHLSTFIAADPADVYRYAADVSRWPEWAAGIATGIRPEGDHWVVSSPYGDVTVQLAPPNDYGVLDHVVTLPDGVRVDNPLRVLAAEGGAEVVFTVRWREGMSEEEYAADLDAVRADLETLKARLE